MKTIKQISKVIVTAISVMVFGLLAGMGGTTSSVYAMESSAASGSESLIQELKRLTIDGKPFTAEDYPANAEGAPQLLMLYESGYSFYSYADKLYGLTLYVYNPALLAVKNDVRNTVQMRVGKAKDYSKYVLTLADSAENNLYCKFTVNLSEADKSAVLKNLDKEQRDYDVSSIELVSGTDINATDYPISRLFTFTGYAGGLGENVSDESTLTGTLSWTVKGGSEAIPLKVEHTSWRPEGTNGADRYTQDVINSVYFAVPKEFDDKYDYLQAVKAQWYKCKLVPILVSGNAELLEDMRNMLLYNVETAALLQQQMPLQFNYKTGINRKTGNEIDFDWVLTTAAPSYGFASVPAYDYFYGRDKHYSYFDTQYVTTGAGTNTYKDRVYYRQELGFYLTVDTGGIKPADYTVSSDETLELLKAQSEFVLDNFPEQRNQKVAGKYPRNLFTLYQSAPTVKLITIDRNATADDNTLIVTSDNLKLNDVKLKQDFWQKVFGGISEASSEQFKDITPIEEVTEEKILGKGNSELCKNLYISENDCDKFIQFYKDNKDTSTIYLMRFDVSDYKAYTVDESKYQNTVYVHKSKGYVAETWSYLDFDLIDFEYVKEDEVYVLPVSMSPIDIIPELTPPVELVTSVSDFWKYGLIIMAVLLVIWIIYRVITKKVR